MSDSPPTSGSAPGNNSIYWIALAVSLLLCSIIAMVNHQLKMRTDQEFRSERESDLVRVVIFKPMAHQDLVEKVRQFSFFGMLAIIGCLVIGAFKHGKYLFGLGGLLVLFVIFPVSCTKTMPELMAPQWHASDPVRGPNGQDYYCLHAWVLQYAPICLGQLISEDQDKREFKILGETNGDNPRSFQILIRPQKTGQEKSLLITPDNRYLVQIRQKNYCYYAFDFEKKIFLGHGDVVSVSPFMLVGPTDSLNEDDVAELRRAAQGIKTTDDDYRVPNHIEDGLNHPNPAVRKLAADIIELTKRHPGSSMQNHRENHNRAHGPR